MNIYIDITDLLYFAMSNSTVSGIQRMTFTLLNQLSSAGLLDQIRLIATHPETGTLRELSRDYFKNFPTLVQDEFWSAYGIGSHVSLNQYVERRYHGKHQKWHRIRLRFKNLMTNGKTFSSRKILPRADRCIQRDLKIGTPVTVIPGDLVFLPGAIWDFPFHIENIVSLAHRGAKILPFVHDLIPLVGKTYTSTSATEKFSHWLERIVPVSDAFIVNSIATRNDLRRYLARYENQDKAIHRIALAHEFTSHSRHGESFDPSQLAAMPHEISKILRSPYVLCVGTLETRKNIERLTYAWRILEAELSEKLPHLVFAGKRGSVHPSFDENINQMKGKVAIIQTPSDNLLAQLYCSAQFTVFVSLFEGWGMPVGESLWFGTPVLASSSSSIPEVGKELVDYIDPHSTADLIRGIRMMVENPDHRQQMREKIRAAKLRTWHAVAEEIWTLIGSLAELEARAQPLASRESKGWSGAAA